MSAEANAAFKKCVIQDPDFRDLTELLVAMFFQARGHPDRAIQIATQVLTRSPTSVLALLVRGEAYKFHPKGSHVAATDDFAHALALDQTVQPLLGFGFGFDDLSRFDEILLKFHPWLWERMPLPIISCDTHLTNRLSRWLLKGRSYFGFIGLLFMFLGKLKRKVRLSRRLAHQQQHEAAFKAQSDAVTDRMRGLFAAGCDAEIWQRERELHMRKIGRATSAKIRRPQPWLPAGKREDKPPPLLCTPTDEDVLGVYRSLPGGEASWQSLTPRSAKSKPATDLISHFPPEVVVNFLSSETRGARHVPDVVKAYELEPVWQWHRDSAAATPPALPEKMPPLQPPSPRLRPCSPTAASLFQEFKDKVEANAWKTHSAQHVNSPWQVCGPEHAEAENAAKTASGQAEESHDSLRLLSPQLSCLAYQEQQMPKKPFAAVNQLEILGPADALEHGSFGPAIEYGCWGSRAGDALCTRSP